jgi:hypothetical protein
VQVFPEHKHEIKKQVKAMIVSGITVPSMSPYAFLVLLMQKNGRTWRFCVDYCRLDEQNVKNTFPMPVLDELLNELDLEAQMLGLLQNFQHQSCSLAAGIKTASQSRHMVSIHWYC